YTAVPSIFCPQKPGCSSKKRIRIILQYLVVSTSMPLLNRCTPYCTNVVTTTQVETSRRRPSLLLLSHHNNAVTHKKTAVYASGQQRSSHSEPRAGRLKTPELALERGG
ncbi:unnamed protein product, partial [Laminaria digitata]